MKQLLSRLSVAGALAASSSALAQDAVQWRVEDGGNGHWYQAIATGPITWTNARIAAENLHGALVSIETGPERAFIFSVFNSVDYAAVYVAQHGTSGLNFGPWIGGRQSPSGQEPLGGWTWLSGIGFDPFEQACCNDGSGCGLDENSLHLYWYEQVNSISWNDLPDAHCGPWPVGYVVEWSADCNSDGIVDFGQIRAGELADANSNNIPDCCEQGVSCAPCPGDIDESGSVDGVDLAIVLTRWGQSSRQYPRADANGDGFVDGSDLSIVLNGWGVCP